MTIPVLAEHGQSGRAIARMLGVDEKAVRYHLKRAAEGAIDGRSLQASKAAGRKDAIAHYLAEQVDEGPVNLAVLHEWLIAEHDFAGSLRGLQRYFRRHFPRPAQRARRRIETPPGAQAQADWGSGRRCGSRAGRCTPTSSTCGCRTVGTGTDGHEYELYLAVENIDHARTKAKSPQTNVICERFRKTVLNELYRVAFRKKLYSSLEELQADVDAWLKVYNEERTHQGRWCYGKTPMQTFLDSVPLAKEKMLVA